MMNATVTSADIRKNHGQVATTQSANGRGVRLHNVTSLSRLDRFFSFTILFIGAWNFCLPVAVHVDLPWWVMKIQVIPLVYINEALFIAYLALGGFTRVRRLILRLEYPNRSASICMIVLAVWCAVSSILSPLPFHDAGRSARLILMAFLLIAATQWASHDPLFVLRTYLIGLIAGTIVNLVFTFANPHVMVGALPRLLGQNTPGPAMGIAVCLSAWLLLFSRERSDVIIAILGTVICGAGAMISYSKIALIACFMGFLCLALVTLRVMTLKKQSVIILSLLLIVTIFGSYYLNTARGQEIYSSFKQMLAEKLKSADLLQSESIQVRRSYLFGVGEILLSHPIGVGFSGFKEAMMRSNAYNSGQAADESAIDPVDSNPHAFLLYYTSAGGLIGGLLSLAVFLLLWRMLHRGLRVYGLVGILVANLTGMAYLVMAISVPYLLNSVIMIIPAAIAAGYLMNRRLGLLST